MELNVSIGECLNDFICGMISSGIIVFFNRNMRGNGVSQNPRKSQKTRLV